MNRKELNEEVAKYLGWSRKEGEDWCSPKGEKDIVDPPDFLNVLDNFVPAIENYWASVFDDTDGM